MQILSLNLSMWKYLAAVWDEGVLLLLFVCFILNIVGFAHDAGSTTVILPT